jgi:hypothetical protein
LLVYVDDATSRIMAARFVEAESTFAYMETTRAYIEHHGKPLAFIVTCTPSLTSIKQSA